VFPVSYELDSYILFKRNSVFKWLMVYFMQSCKEKGKNGFLVSDHTEWEIYQTNVYLWTAIQV
jgi:hypothetical protein